MANSIGGRIVFGIEEARVAGQKLGCADRMAQFSLGDLSKTKELFLNWLSSGCDPKIPGITIYEVMNPADPNSGLLVISIPQSWIQPHMIRESGLFYFRTSGGCERMDTAQLRDSILTSEGITTKVKQFHTDRLGKAYAGDMPVSAKAGPTLVVHCIPYEAFSRLPRRIEFQQNSDSSILQPPGLDSGWNTRRNFDGLLTFPGHAPTSTYLQAFSNGVLEGMSQLFYGMRGGELGAYIVERTLVRMFSTAFKFLSSKQVEPPMVCIASLLHVKGLSISVPTGYWKHDPVDPIDREVLILPELIFEKFDLDLLTSANGQAPTCIKPMIDSLWHACGFEGRLDTR